MDPPTPTDHYSILGVVKDTTQEHIEDAFYGLVERAPYQFQITAAYKVLSDPLLRARCDKSRQPVVRAKSLRLRKFSASERRTSDDDVPSEVTFKSRWPEVLATPRDKSFYQQPAMVRPQPHQLQNKYHAEERSEIPMVYEDVCKTPKGYQVRDRDATTDLYNEDSHCLNEALDPRELKTPSPPNKARLVPPGRQPGCMDNRPHGWKGWYPTNKGLSPADCPICEEFVSKVFCTQCNATT
ncbi:hypothetical protein CCUS01_13301 [Colletotrichum cuscutae]|uniref:J domain-containing protein n=1 Tax=Colletotrichum cuscutae TaxID=1209917 RepID=A0AAI9YCD8_9PEZI|nr:hypothetical protein CCUS01_13301 [Colletotrichum cuscutae]